MEASDLLNLFTLGEHNAGLGCMLWRRCIRDERCPMCQSSIIEYSYEGAKMEVGGTSSKWPDILANLSDIILHERVIETISREKLTGFRSHSIEITKVKRKKLESCIPRYFLLEPTGKVDLNGNELVDESSSICPACFNRNFKAGYTQTIRRIRHIPNLTTWDKSDFVKIGNLCTKWTLCTRRFIDLARVHRWKGFCFGKWVPGIGIYFDQPADLGYINYWEPDWFEKASLKVKAKYPDLFGLSEDEAKKFLPPKPEAAPSPPPVPPKKKSESEEYEERVNALLNPRFDLIEARFKHPVPQPLKELYQNREELLQWRFVVDVPVPQEILDRAGDDAEFEQISVERYEPIDGKTMESWGPGMENYIEFASDGGEGIYCIDPRETDPEVHLFIMDGADLIPLEVPLSEFLSASKRINH